MAGNPHDRFGKAVFGRKACAVAQLRAFLPQQVRDLVDLDSAETVPGSFVDEALAERHTDLLYRVRLGSREAFVYVLFEHQSTVDPTMPFRMLRYLVRIWDRWLEDHPGQRSLPPIVPMVLYHGAAPWTAPTDLTGLLDATPDERSAIAPLLPSLAFVLVDLSQLGDDDLRLVAEHGAALAGLALLVMKHVRAPDLTRRLARWGDLVRRVYLEAGSGLRALETLVRYILEANDCVAPAELGSVLGAATGPDVNDMARSTADRLREEGRLEGRSEGRLEGRSEGRIEGRSEGMVQGAREALLRLLASRFGDLPDPVVTRIQEAELAALNEWLDRALPAPSLDAVFGD